MPYQKFDYAAQWVCQRQKNAMPDAAQGPEIAQTISTLCTLVGKCQAAVMIPDLFPGSALETIYIPADSSDKATSGEAAGFVGESLVTAPALTAIGAALLAELESTGNDMVLCNLDEGAQAIAYRPEVRNTVLQSTGLVLINL